MCYDTEPTELIVCPERVRYPPHSLLRVTDDGLLLDDWSVTVSVPQVPDVRTDRASRAERLCMGFRTDDTFRPSTHVNVSR